MRGKLLFAASAFALIGIAGCKKLQSPLACPPTRAASVAVETIIGGREEAKDAEPVVVNSNQAYVNGR